MKIQNLAMCFGLLYTACESKPVVLSIEPSDDEPSEPSVDTYPHQPSSEPSTQPTSEPTVDSSDSGQHPVGPNDDSDGDGWTNREEGYNGAGNHTDSDGDGIPNYLDTDSDNDGLPDSQETMDDPDNDRIPNYADADSDNDGLSDYIEANYDPNTGTYQDADGDGLDDYEDIDSDNDGIFDTVENQPRDSNGMPIDTDGDGMPDYCDPDADGDSLLDEDEGRGDWDNDGIENYRDPINSGPVPNITLIPISTPFNSPVGIDYHVPSNSVVMSVNYSSGSPINFELVHQNGNHNQFSSVSGLTEEVKIATVRLNNVGGFLPGELYVGNGNDGEIVRVEASGFPVHNPWVSLPGSNNGLMRGSIYIDDTGDFGGDLIAVTTNGEVWRITSAGVATMLADVNVHLEGLITVPNAPARYGPLAGKIIAGAEGQGLLYAFDASGAYTTYSLGVNVEDIDLIRQNENFFGVNFGSSRLLGVPFFELTSMTGDILLTQESHSQSVTGLYWLHFDGNSLQVDQLGYSATSTYSAQWEHVTFSPSGIVEIAPVTP